MSNERKTAGQIILEHDAKRIDLEDDVREYRAAMTPSVIDMIHKTAMKAKGQYPYINKDFYIVFTFTNDRVLQQPKPMVWARQSCPTPVYKQSVWKYMHNSGSLEYLWTIPDMFKYWDIVKRPQFYLQDKERAQGAQFVLLMESGELLQWVKKENGEKIDAVIKIIPKENECLIQ